LAHCGNYPTSGTTGDETGNTLQCREYHLGVATDGDTAAKAMHCPRASRLGGSVCGTSAAAFCNDAPVVCPAQYVSTAACDTSAALCATNAIGVSTGNSLQCRDYFLGLAMAGGAAAKAANCPDAAADGGSACIGPNGLSCVSVSISPSGLQCNTI
jgi:hypothetical protein